MNEHGIAVDGTEIDPLDELLETQATCYRKGMFQDTRSPTQKRKDAEKKREASRPRSRNSIPASRRSLFGDAFTETERKVNDYGKKVVIDR